MDSVGYDMYMQLLSRAIAEEKGELVSRPSECTVDIRVNAYIPDTYIESAFLRVDIYKKISGIAEEADCSDIIDELCDRFGEPPAEVLDLIDVALIRAQCSAAGVVELTQADRLLQFYMADNNIEKIAGHRLRFRREDVLQRGRQALPILPARGRPGAHGEGGGEKAERACRRRKENET